MTLTWTRLFLVLVAPATGLAPLAAQPVSLTGTSAGLALSRQSLITPLETSSVPAPLVLDASLVLATAAHLTTLDDAEITTTAAARPTLGYLPESSAATPSNIDRFLTVSLGRLDAPPAVSSRTTTSALAPPRSSVVPTFAAAAPPANVRLTSQLAPTSSRLPTVNLPRTSSSGLSGTLATGTRVPLGRGTIAGGSNLNPVGIPEPSTYLLCGGLLVLGGYWHLRRRAKPTTETPQDSAVNLQTVAFETGESLSK
jgi:hypothetical protein